MVYLQGARGALADMDVACDGQRRRRPGPARDGRCDAARDARGQTAFAEIVRGYGAGVRDLDPYGRPFVVFGNVRGRGGGHGGGGGGRGGGGGGKGGDDDGEDGGADDGEGGWSGGSTETTGAVGTFDPRQYGIEPLSVMAVVCGKQMVRFPVPSTFFPFPFPYHISPVYVSFA